MSTNNIVHSGCPVVSITCDIINKTHDLVMGYSKLKVREVDSAGDMFSERIINTLYTILTRKTIFDSLRSETILGQQVQFH